MERNILNVESHLGCCLVSVFTEETLQTVKDDVVCSVDDVCNHAAILWRQKSFGKQTRDHASITQDLRKLALGSAKI